MTPEIIMEKPSIFSLRKQYKGWMDKLTDGVEDFITRKGFYPSVFYNENDINHPELGIRAAIPAGSDLHIQEDKDILFHNCVVVMDMGSFDYPLKSFKTQGAAEIYLNNYLTLQLSLPHIEIKKPEEVRHLQETFVKDDILICLEGY